MNQNTFSSQAAQELNTKTEDEIDLRQIAETLLRRKSLIVTIAAISLALAALNAYTRKPVWEGQFEIVVANNKSSVSPTPQLLQSNPGLANLIGGGGTNEQLKTEIEILESPSVLKPIFEYVKQHKQKQGIDVANFRYTDWSSNLSIDLVKGTSVLELAYKDTDKELVLPVIKRISETYQDYSGRDRERGINQAIQYLNQL